MANITKGWYYNSTGTEHRFGVYNSSNAVKDVFDEDGHLYHGGTEITSTAAELNLLDGTTAGTVVASKAVAVGSSKQVNEWFVTKTSASTDGGTSVEAMVVDTTMTGAGGVGGRARFQLNANAALGSWSNALKGVVVYGASGKTAGLGSAILAEMTLSAGTVDGTYAPFEAEVNVGSGAAIGTKASFMYFSAQGDGVATWNAGAGLFNLATVIDTGNMVQASAVSDIDSTHALKVFVNGTAYYIPMHTSAAFGG